MAIFRPAHETRPRYLILAGVVLLHVAAIAWLLSTQFDRTLPPRAEFTVVSLAMTAKTPEPPSAPPPPPPPVKTAEPIPLILPPAPDVPPDVPIAPHLNATTTAPGSECAPLDTVATELSADLAVRAAIMRAPPATRSVAEAIVIWNAGWSETTASIEAPLAPVRSAVERALATLPLACLDAPIAGPRLIPISGGRGTTIFVFGSGIWAWAQLLGPAPS